MFGQWYRNGTACVPIYTNTKSWRLFFLLQCHHDISLQNYDIWSYCYHLIGCFLFVKYILYCNILYSTIQLIWDINLHEPYRFWYIKTLYLSWANDLFQGLSVAIFAIYIQYFRCIEFITISCHQWPRVICVPFYNVTKPDCTALNYQTHFHHPQHLAKRQISRDLCSSFERYGMPLGTPKLWLSSKQI